MGDPCTHCYSTKARLYVGIGMYLQLMNLDLQKTELNHMNREWNQNQIISACVLS